MQSNSIKFKTKAHFLLFETIFLYLCSQIIIDSTFPHPVVSVIIQFSSAITIFFSYYHVTKTEVVHLVSELQSAGVNLVTAKCPQTVL